ncbi:MAG: N-acetylmuramoyl-L-alanine amidase [Muribaculaceae bacterium]|nr:N-acetylmuramoyl-L-alanine amidase [Muribaculaceae bacterium]
MREIDKIIIHCTATKAGREVTVEEVTAWHKGRGFRTIGYHYLIGLDGKISAGRPEREVGAHCLGQNGHSIGVCYVGGLDERGQPQDTRTEAQKESLRGLVAELRRRYPGASVHGHREFAAKACPCFDVGREM